MKYMQYLNLIHKLTPFRKHDQWWTRINLKQKMYICTIITSTCLRQETWFHSAVSASQPPQQKLLPTRRSVILVSFWDSRIGTDEHSLWFSLLLIFYCRFTQEPELYVLESTKNIDGFIDPFTEESDYGVNIFRLYERLHQFHGVSVSFGFPCVYLANNIRYGGVLSVSPSTNACTFRPSSGCGVSTNWTRIWIWKKIRS